MQSSLKDSYNEPMLKKLLALSTMAVILWNTSLFAKSVEDPAWEHYISQQKKMQSALHHITKLFGPEYEPLLKQSHELELALAEEKTHRFYYLAENEPERITRDQGFAAFVNFLWTDQDQETLAENDQDYRSLERRIDKLSYEVQNDPDYEDLKERLESVKSNVRYKEVWARFRFVDKEVEEILNRRNEKKEENILQVRI